MEINKIKKVTPTGSQNIILHQISKKYSVVFYTTPHFLVFQYCWDDGIDFYKTNRNVVLWWISLEEREKLFAFEREKKKEFRTIVMYGAPDDDEKNLMRQKNKIK